MFDDIIALHESASSFKGIAQKIIFFNASLTYTSNVKEMPEIYEVIKSSKANGSVQDAGTDSGDPPEGGNSASFTVVALCFKAPSYVKVDADRDINFDTKLEVDGDSVSYEKSKIGKVVERRSVEDVKVDTTYDIKYTGGYSLDGKKVYLDSDFPKKLSINGKEVDTIESIAKHHELTEKWMVGEGYTYQYAHIIANKIEREYVESLGVDWGEYSKEVEKWLSQISSKKLARSPADLDLAPYTASNDSATLEEIKNSIAK